MKYAAHTDLLVLGIGETESEAIQDAVYQGAEESLLDVVQITDDAADYVERGGDCRGLTIGDNFGEDCFYLRDNAPPPYRLQRRLDMTTATDLMREFRVMQSGDWWGDTMHWWFTVAEEMYERGMDIPESWRYRQSPLGSQNDPEDYATEAVREASDNGLRLFGRALTRYAAKLKAQGEDY